MGTETKDHRTVIYTPDAARHFGQDILTFLEKKIPIHEPVVILAPSDFVLQDGRLRLSDTAKHILSQNGFSTHDIADINSSTLYTEKPEKPLDGRYLGYIVRTQQTGVVMMWGDSSLPSRIIGGDDYLNSEDKQKLKMNPKDLEILTLLHESGHHLDICGLPEQPGEERYADSWEFLADKYGFRLQLDAAKEGLLQNPESVIARLAMIATDAMMEARPSYSPASIFILPPGKLEGTLSYDIGHADPYIDVINATRDRVHAEAGEQRTPEAIYRATKKLFESGAFNDDPLQKQFAQNFLFAAERYGKSTFKTNGNLTVDPEEYLKILKEIERQKPKISAGQYDYLAAEMRGLLGNKGIKIQDGAMKIGVLSPSAFFALHADPFGTAAVGDLNFTQRPLSAAAVKQTYKAPAT